VTLYAYTPRSNHIHLLLQAPTTDALGRPLRWFMTETAKAFQKPAAGAATSGSGATGPVWSKTISTPSPRSGTWTEQKVPDTFWRLTG
jgi:hypothetical protein